MRAMLTRKSPVLLICVTLPPFHHSQTIRATLAATTPTASQSGIVGRSPPRGHGVGPAGTWSRGRGCVDVGHGGQESSRPWEPAVTSMRAT